MACYYDSRGRRKRKSLGPKASIPKREAVARCREMAASFAVQPGRREAGKAPSLGDWLTRFAELRTHDVAASTMKAVGVTADYLREHFGDGIRIDRITRSDLSSWRAGLAKKGLADPTLRKHCRHAKVIFGTAVELELLAANPAVRLASAVVASDKPWHDLTAAQADAFVAACRGPYRTLAALCAYAGLRKGEALRLQRADIMPDRLCVRHEGRRTTKKRAREVLIVDELRPHLKAASGSIYTAGCLLCDGIGINIDRHLRAAMKRAKLEPWAKPLHTLRAWRARTWRDQYPDFVVNLWLGHSQAVAMDHYANIVPAGYYGPKADPLAGMTEEQLRDLQALIATKLPQSTG